MQPDAARAEQAWIDERIAAGIDAPQAMLVHYAAPALIHGRRGPADGAIAARARAAGCDVVQRRSGGGVVLAGPWLLGLDLLLPAAHPLSQGGPIAAFNALGAHLRERLAAVGVPTRLAQAADIARHKAAARDAGVEGICFAGLSHGELLDADGRKLVGLAQSRGRWGCLLSAGLLLAATPWEMLETIHLGRRCERSAMHELAAAGMTGMAAWHPAQWRAHLLVGPWAPARPDASEWEKEGMAYEHE